MTYIRLFNLCLIIVLVVDVSGFADDLRRAIARWLNTSPERIATKPLFCSKCLTVWLGLAYALIVGELTLAVVLYILALGVMTANLATLIRITIEAVRNLLDKIFRTLC